MAEEAPIGNDEPRQAVLLPIADVINTAVPEQEEMAHFQHSIARFADFPRLRGLRWLPVFAALAAVAAPDAAEAARRQGRGGL